MGAASLPVFAERDLATLFDKSLVRAVNSQLRGLLRGCSVQVIRLQVVLEDVVVDVGLRGFEPLVPDLLSPSAPSVSRQLLDPGDDSSAVGQLAAGSAKAHTLFASLR
jgi:hypothetical protein